MNRAEYNECLRPYISGQKDQAQRKLDFCIGAKVCSGKAKTDEEAKTICLNTPPGEAKPRKRKSCGCDLDAIAACAAPKIIRHILETDIDVTPELIVEYFTQCAGGTHIGTTPSREKFIKKCFKENSTSGTAQVDMKEATKLRTFCITEYKRITGGLSEKG